MACRHKTPAPPVPQPPAPTARPQSRAPRQPAAQKPAPAAVQPAPLPAPRTPQNLQSSVDAAGDRPAIEARMKEVRSQLDLLQRRTLTGGAAQDRDRIGSMLDLAQQALLRGNLRQAEDLSTRAAMLAKTLLDVR